MVALTRAALASVVAAVPAAGCLSIPRYEPPPSALSYAEDGSGGATVATGDFALHFASGPGFHFPDALTIGGTDVIDHEATAPCYGEDGVGLMISPTPRISAATGAPVTTNQLTPTLRGPAVVQVRVDWNSQFTCADNRPGGSALYTVFLDGRIVRRDAIDDQRPGNFARDDCACDAGHSQGFQIASFWTLDPAAFMTITVPGSTSGAMRLPSDPAAPFVNTNFYVACLDAAGYQVAVAWSRSPEIVGTPRIFASPAQLVFSRERTGGFVSTLDPLAWTTNDALFVERGGCKTAIARATEHSDAAKLTVDGAAAPIEVSLVDGIYGGDRGDGTAPGIPVSPGRVELTGPVNGSFAVWLRFSTAVDGVRAALAGRTGAWYVLQRIDDTSWIAWFRDPLMAGETIALETI